MEKHNNEKIDQLRTLAREAQAYQQERELTDSAICKEIAQLGSTKTYKRILDPEDDLSELNVDNQIRNYTSALDLIKLLRQKNRPIEPEYTDFDNVDSSMSAVSKALQEESIARLVIIKGENGTGKDAVKNALLNRWGKIIVATEANEFWRESLAEPLREMLEAVSKLDGQKLATHAFPARMLETFLNAVKDRKLVLLINEAHHLGPRTLNLIKTLINRSKLVIVMLCIPRLLNRLLTNSYEEAIQLTGNRLCEMVTLKAPPANEILLLLERRGLEMTDATTANQVAQAIAAAAPQFGNWRFVGKVSREMRKVGAGKPIVLAQFSTALTEARRKCVATQQQAI